MNDSLRALAPNLSKAAPRSPRVLLGNYAMAARILDKCRASLAAQAGDYHFNCPLDRMFFGFTKIHSEEFKSFVASGASDAEVAQWIEKHSVVDNPIKIKGWNMLATLNP